MELKKYCDSEGVSHFKNSISSHCERSGFDKFLNFIINGNESPEADEILNIILFDTLETFSEHFGKMVKTGYFIEIED